MSRLHLWETYSRTNSTTKANSLAYPRDEAFQPEDEAKKVFQDVATATSIKTIDQTSLGLLSLERTDLICQNSVFRLGASYSKYCK